MEGRFRLRKKFVLFKKISNLSNEIREKRNYTKNFENKSIYRTCFKISSISDLPAAILSVQCFYFSNI